MCNCNQSLPPKTTMAGHAVAAAVRIVAATVRGQPVKAASETMAARLAVCVACPQVLNFPNANGKTYHRCAKCGCWLDSDYAGKASLLTETCPEGRWP